MEALRKLIKGLDPIADAFAGTVYSDIVSMRNYKYAEFIIYKGVGTTGTSTITVEACDDVSASTTSAVVFSYQAITSGDTPGALTKATVAGFATTAGSSEIYRIVVDSAELAATEYEFVRLAAVEVANDPVLGGVLISLYGGNDGRDVPATAIV